MKSDADAMADFDREFAENLAAVTPPGRATSKPLPDIDEPPPVNGLQDYGLSDGERVEDEVAEKPPAAKPVAKTKTIKPLALLDASQWQGKPVPQRQWLARNRIPVGKPALLSGDGATGKTTIAVQLTEAVKRGTSWLGSVIERQGDVLIFTAEEDDDEMHYRSAAVAEHSGLSMSDLAGLRFHCLPGQDAVLGLPDRSGVIRPTPLYERLEETVKQFAPVLVILEAAADLFACDENNRNHARQSVGLLTRLCNLPSRPSVVLLAHPSLSGLASGRGTSGSTGWHNSVRARMYLRTPAKTADESDEATDGIRILEVKKSNYGPDGETVKLRWENGVYVPHGAVTSLAQIATETQADGAFLRCLDAATAQGIDVSPKPGRNAAWKVFADMPEAKPFKARALEMAMRRLLSASKIISITVGSKSREKAKLVRTGGEA